MPLAAFAPVHDPEAVQDVGLLVADQDKVEDPPTVVDIGLAVILTTGGGGKLTVKGMLLTVVVPPELVHDKPYR